jgi:hypothetical protein
MIIKKDWSLELTNQKTNIICKVLFRVIDHSRKVNIETTAALICEIKETIGLYSKNVPPDTKDRQKFQNQEYAKQYLNKWEYWLAFLIPENRVADGHYTEQQAVELNHELLNPNKLLTYNQALFLLLGLNAVELGTNIINFPILDGEIPSIPREHIEYYFWSTRQNQELKTSAYVKNGKITSEDLIKLAEEHSFFIQEDSRIAKRHIDKNVSKKIYNVLINHDYITGDYDDMWAWNKSIARNKLSYFARRLKQKYILGDQCHKELSNYIPDPNPSTKKPLKNITEISPKAIKIIDSIVDEIIK